MRITISLLFQLYALEFFAQNLILNGGFESYNACPQFLDNLSNVNNCINFGGTCDYYNACLNGEGYSTIPNNSFGYQYALEGNGYVGLSNLELNSDYRELVGIELSESLIIGEEYFVSFYVSPAYTFESSYALFTNNIGIKFAISGVQDSTYLMNGQDVAHAESVISDTSLWIQVKGSFIADAAYDLAVIGNFHSNDDTDYEQEFFYEIISYQYIDDVRVSNDSAYAWEPLSIAETEADLWKVFNSMNGEGISIYSRESNSLLVIFDLNGRLCSNKELDYGLNYYETSHLSKGIYLVRLISNDKTKINTFKIISK